MIKKTFKYLLRGLLYLLIVLIMVPTLLYIPFIQNFIRDKAESYVNTHTDMKLSIGDIRLAFPLNLAIDHVLVTQELSDTLLYCDQLRLRIALWPLLNQQVRIRNFSLDQTIANYTDTTSNLTLQAKIGTLKLKTNGIDLRYWKNENTAELEFVIQDDTDVIPVEVKKGTKVKAISMNTFVKEYNSSIAYRISSRNFGFANGIKSIPLYAVFCINRI